MVKPSLKTTIFKHHPVYLQKPLHVDYPFYGPKPMYQRAEVITGGDCEAVLADWAEDDNLVWDRTPVGSGRVGSDSMLMTKTGATVTDSSIYLLLDAPIDLSWAKYVGFWYKGTDNQPYLANDIYFYIFTASGNYAYANAARYVDPIGVYTEKNPAVWHYAEVDIDDFIINTGYGADKLEKVWGIGFCAHGIGAAETMQVDQIEFYTVGTGLGPARGLIMSAPLYDDIYAARGYGLAWNEFSGRIDHSAVDDYAFAGICTGNPSRTKLWADGASDATSIIVEDASLLRAGKASIGDSATGPTEHTISAVNKVTRTITVSALAANYTTVRNAYIAMQGNEEGTVRADFMVNGVVNLEAAGEVLLSYGCTCAVLGNAPFTVSQVAASEHGQIIGKAVTAAAGVGEVFPVILTTCAYATGHDDAELLGKFVVNQWQEDLLGKFDVGQGSAELLGKFTSNP